MVISRRSFLLGAAAAVPVVALSGLVLPGEALTGMTLEQAMLELAQIKIPRRLVVWTNQTEFIEWAQQCNPLVWSA